MEFSQQGYTVFERFADTAVVMENNGFMPRLPSILKEVPLEKILSRYKDKFDLSEDMSDCRNWTNGSPIVNIGTQMLNDEAQKRKAGRYTKTLLDLMEEEEG